MEHKLDETSESLLAAAHRLLSEQGSEALTVRRIATEAGMSTMNVYSRFGGKDGVVDVLYIDGFERLLAAIDAVPATDDVGDDLVRIAEVYRSFALANPTYYRVMFRSAINEFRPSARANEVALGALRLLTERVVGGQAIGQIVAGDEHPAEEIAAFLWATCHGIVSLELSGVATERVEWPSVFEIGLRTAVGGLRTFARQSIG